MIATQLDLDGTYREILSEGVILCLRLGAGHDIPELARAAARGGLRVLELTLTTPGALEAMASLTRGRESKAQDAHGATGLAGVGGLVVGGGTVLTVDQVREVRRAGGRFVLSPVFDRQVVDEAHRLGLLAIPGAATPTEVLAAHRHGVRAVKIFPAAILGGPAYLRTIRGPLPHVPLVPTSGPTADTLADYIAAGAVAVGVGAEVFPPGFTPASVEAAALRVRRAIDLCRSKPDPGTS